MEKVRGVTRREIEFVQPALDTTPTPVRVVRGCRVPLQPGGRVQAAQPGLVLTLPRHVAMMLAAAGRVELVIA